MTEKKQQPNGSPAPAPPAAFTEAPASFNVKALSPLGYDCMLTLRSGDTGDLMIRAINAINWLSAQGFRPTGNGYSGPANAQAPAAAPAPPAATPGATPAPAAAPETGETLCNRMNVGTSRTGKTQLQFMTQDGKLSCTLDMAAMIDLLPPGWAAEHIQPGLSYDVNFRIGWKRSGKYRNVVSIENA